MSAQQKQLQNVTAAEFRVFMDQYKQDAVSLLFLKERLCDCLFWYFQISNAQRRNTENRFIFSIVVKPWVRRVVDIRIETKCVIYELNLRQHCAVYARVTKRFICLCLWYRTLCSGWRATCLRTCALHSWRAAPTRCGPSAPPAEKAWYLCYTLRMNSPLQFPGLCKGDQVTLNSSVIAIIRIVRCLWSDLDYLRVVMNS